MARHTTRWSPDTCDCVIEYEWDDNDPPESRAHNLTNYLNKCSAHSPLSTDNNRYSIVKDENTRKNITYGTVLENAPREFYDEVINYDNDGNEVLTRQLRKEVRFNFNWSGNAPNRLLNINYTGPPIIINRLDQSRRNSIKTIIDTRVGANKVVLS